MQPNVELDSLLDKHAQFRAQVKSLNDATIKYLNKIGGDWGIDWSAGADSEHQFQYQDIRKIGGISRIVSRYYLRNNLFSVSIFEGNILMYYFPDLNREKYLKMIKSEVKLRNFK